MMDNALIGFLVVFGFLHFLLVAIPVMDIARAKISVKGKIVWCGIILFLPLIGVAIMHFRYKTSLFQGKAYEASSAEERARSGTLAPRDQDLPP